jgi:hypothetical protein
MLNYWHGAIQRLCLLKAIDCFGCFASKFQIHFLFEFSSGGKTGSAHASADPVIDCGMNVVVSNLEEFCQRDDRR